MRKRLLKQESKYLKPLDIRGLSGPSRIRQHRGSMETPQHQTVWETTLRPIYRNEITTDEKSVLPSCTLYQTKLLSLGRWSHTKNSCDLFMEYHPQTALADEAKEAELIWIERNSGLLALDDQGRPGTPIQYQKNPSTQTQAAILEFPSQPASTSNSPNRQTHLPLKIRPYVAPALAPSAYSKK
ncbi:hypothetical protein [Pseudomonas viridiflava]|jgi:hypothetical protein|uniref:hypothetical protein n=1 Tax=Pseudomonas viridiflava TaxID=33069 RepID=UPI000F023D75|nr:hypothetical protein [Pseudomonas viridiflava]